MKRFIGELFEDYKLRRKGEDLVTRAHLKGRFASGRYADMALHNSMQKTGDDSRNRKWWASVGFKFLVIGVFLVFWYYLYEHLIINPV